MRDIVIRGRSMRRELVVLAACVLLALLINAAAIVLYGTRWIELLTTVHITLMLALGLYVVAGVLRLGWLGLRSVFRLGRHRVGTHA